MDSVAAAAAAVGAAAASRGIIGKSRPSSRDVTSLLFKSTASFGKVA
jgi:hypothetical protein